ncbi:MAG: hypothetical protein AN490_03925 [Anabaena sp. AL09]|nr:MAG: hypothetical protein AN490_03925 [Anabaena sp. AL09]
MWGCDSEALRRNRFWGVEVRSLFWEVWGCDSEALRRNRFWGCGDAIAKRSVRIAFGVWECDSEALRRNRFLGMWGMRSLFDQ